MNKTFNNFNKYSLYAFLILITLPIIYLFFPKIFSSYFDAFDKLSIPLWGALYSLYWLKYTKGIKDTNQQIIKYKQRTEAFEKINNKEYFDEYKSNLEQLSINKTNLNAFKLHIDFINNALRISVIIAAVVKIVQLILNLINY